MICKTYKSLYSIRKKNKDKKLVFCSGSFDLPHAGHVLFFEDCRKHGDVLVVGVGSDKMIKKGKGPNRPVLNEHIRVKTVDSFKPVDYCFLDKISDRVNPLGLLDVVFKKMHPDIYAVNEDAFDIPYRKSLARQFGVKMIVLKRRCPLKFEKISTSNIIKKIKNA